MTTQNNISFREWCRIKYEETGDRSWKELGDALKDEIVEYLGLEYRVIPRKKRTFLIGVDNCYECPFWEYQAWFEGVESQGRYFCHRYKRKIGKTREKTQHLMENGFPEFCKEEI